MTERGRPRTAVIGGGVSGLTAAYVLARRHEVTLHEADDRLGGHAHTHEVKGPDGQVRSVDSGFIVHNDRTYPYLLRLFRELGVATRPTTMSLSVHCEGCGLEYAGARGPRGLFARPGGSLRPAYLRMLAQVPVFHRQARRLLTAPEGAREPTLGEFLERGGFGPYFTGHFAIPLVASVWSCPPGTALRYPARYLFRFLAHHGLLSVGGSPSWRTVEGGSARYVERVREELGAGAVRVADAVRELARTPEGVVVTTADGTRTRYDSVVVAVHADQALRMLADPTDAEREVLGAFGYSRNRTVLHTDASVLPRTAGARACWNYRLSACRPDEEVPVQVSYDMNRLQGLDAPEPYVVTLGADERVRPDLVLAEMVYEHPVYTPESVAAQRLLPGLSGPVTAFAGAYHGWGFHEDGCRSGVEAAAALGVGW
ncbi:NAD(P)/FAD-dependent oxidoreductase [Streptomyces sp. NPDC054904]|uniref:NAD(P)/FAD-dependent oxidoreductase n=1 Tax=unclassified Streptomyces TaxID=2593676 RepID=UPI002481E114|nr:MULTISPECIES: FAD-dependent oxidoreductase [unclassified Streptomyces]MDA5282883.1 FAD-dependent oxidoreductase [Streptomyces sp. Isolate_45]MDX2391535.1 FAD-dependent oxidoreductase [Streptomyces sp. DK15]